MSGITVKVDFNDLNAIYNHVELVKNHQENNDSWQTLLGNVQNRIAMSAVYHYLYGPYSNDNRFNDTDSNHPDFNGRIDGYHHVNNLIHVDSALTKDSVPYDLIVKATNKGNHCIIIDESLAESLTKSTSFNEIRAFIGVNVDKEQIIDYLINNLYNNISGKLVPLNVVIKGVVPMYKLKQAIKDNSIDNKCMGKKIDNSYCFYDDDAHLKIPVKKSLEPEKAFVDVLNL